MTPQDTSNLTAANFDMAGEDRDVATINDSGVRVQFNWEKVRVTDVDPAGNGKVYDQLIVIKTPISDGKTSSRAYITEEAAQRLYPKEYARFTRLDQLPAFGTPLQELPGITQSQVGRLLIQGFQSVEDLVSIDYTSIETMGQDILEAHKTAKKWIDTKEGNAALLDTAAVETAAEAQIASMKKQLEAIKEQNNKLSAENTALKSVTGTPQQAAPGGGKMAAGAEADAPDEAFADLPDPFLEGPDIVTLGEAEDV